MEDPLLGQKLGNYVVQSLIGRGGMGAVYVAEHPEIGRRVAVKVLAPELSHVPGLSERFVAEARAATRIEHPNVITIFDFGRTASGQLYQVIELLRGRDLSQVIAERGAMPVAEVVPYVEQLCDGLAAAHEQSVIHRDLKPENVFVLDRTPLTLKILDFGIAKLLEPGAQQSHTVTGMVIGSPFTIAPEQAAGQRDAICPQTDLYSLGVIIYWLLAGRPPFADAPTAVLLAKHITDTPPPLASLVPTLPPPVTAIVHLCLEKDPARRPASARELREGFLAAARAPIPAPLPEIRSGVPATIIGGQPSTPMPRADPGWAPLPRPAPAATTLRGAAAEVVARPGSAPRRKVLWLGLAAAATAGVAAAATIALWPRTPMLGVSADPKQSATQVGRASATGTAGSDASRTVLLAATKPDAAPLAAPRPDAAPLAVAKPVERKTKAAPNPVAKRKPAKPANPANPPNESVDALLTEAKNAYLGGQHRQVIQLARKVLRAEPNNSQALRLLGVAACYLKDQQAARFAYSRLSGSQAQVLKQNCQRSGVALDASSGSAPPPAAGGRASLSPTEIHQGMRAAIQTSIGLCRRGNAPGQARVQVTIAPSGKVSSARVTGDLAGSRTAACIEAAIRGRARFPSFSGSAVTVTFPLVLR